MKGLHLIQLLIPKISPKPSCRNNVKPKPLYELYDQIIMGTIL